MTDDLDALLKDMPISPPTMAGSQGLPDCKHPKHKRYTEMGVRFCVCGHEFDPVVSRRSKNNGKRGRAIQRQRIVGLGGKNLPGNAENHDGIGEMFSYESKSGGAFSDRYWRWLTGIPVNANQTRVLIVTDAPGPGHRARSYVVVEYSEWKDLHGEIVK